MRFFFILFLLLHYHSFLNAQYQEKKLNDLRASSKNTNEETLTYKDVSGSPYKYNEFKPGQVIFKGNSDTTYKMNYDLYQNALEYEENESIYAVTNADDISKIIIDQDVIIYSKYFENDILKKGFFIEIISDFVSLYKKESVSVKPIRKSSIEYINSNHEIKFNKKRDRYYLSIYGDPLVLITTKKELLKQFFSHPVVRDYIKNEKIRINSEKDLIKLVTFLNNYDKNK